MKDMDLNSKKAGIKFAATLMFLTNIPNLILSLLNTYNFMIYETNFDGRSIAIDLIFSLAIAFISIGLFRLQDWSYNWAEGTAILNSGIYFVYIMQGYYNTYIFSLVIYLVITIFLIKNKEVFKTGEEF